MLLHPCLLLIGFSVSSEKSHMKINFLSNDWYNDQYKQEFILLAT